MFAPLSHHPFQLQFAAQSATVIGSTLSPVALSFGILAATGSPAALGMALTAYAVPLVIFLLVGGVWADRLSRQRVMLTADAVLALAQITLGTMLLSGNVHLWAIALIQVVSGTATAFYHPASTGLTKSTVPRELLQQANALLSLTRSIAGSTGPLLASVLVVSIGSGWALIADGMTFAASALILRRLAVPRKSDPAVRDSFFRELREGFSEVLSRGWVLNSIAVFTVSNLAFAALNVIGPALFFQQTDGALKWGVLLAALNIGTVVGNLTALRWKPNRTIFAARIVEIAQVPLFISIAADAPLLLTVSAALVAGIGISLPDALWYSTLQEQLPENVISRVASYDWLGSLALRPIGYSVSATIASGLGEAGTIMLGGLAILLTRVIGAMHPSVHALDRRYSTESAAPAASNE
ncbi:MFS transporter [Salinispora arenicola]|nr:MFS transporter [Salinispora arenicola]